MSAARVESEGRLEGAQGTPVRVPAGRRRFEEGAVVAILLLGVLLRSAQYFGGTSLNFDELAVALSVRDRSLAALVSEPLAFFQVAPAGFLAAVKLSTLLLGANETGLRLVPWLSSLAALFLFWRVAVRFLSGAPLLAALLLFAVSPSLVWFGNNLKPYSGDVAATLLLVLLGLRYVERPEERRAAFLGGLVGAISLFLSFPAVPTAAIVVTLLVWRRARERPQAPAGALLALSVPWALAGAVAVVLALGLKSAETDVYMRRFWAQDFPPAPWEGLGALLWMPDRLFSILGFQLLFIAREWGFGRIFVGACTALACVGLVDQFRRNPWKGALLTVPTLAAILAAAMHILPFELRVSLYAGWPLELCAAAGLQALQRGAPARLRAITVVLTILIAAVPTLLVAAFRPPYHFQESRQVLGELARRWRPGDRLYLYFGARHAASFYGPTVGLTAGFVGDCHRGQPREYFRELDQFRGQPRLWLFFTHSSVGFREPEAIRTYLETIGVERDRIPDPFGVQGQGEAAAYLYDLSDPARLAAATADTHHVPAPPAGELRVLCDGTHVTGT